MDVKRDETKRFQPSEIHGSLMDPILDSINFLNEVIDQYPSAISFAPGAPFAGLFDDLDVSQFIVRFEQYLRDEKQLSERQIKKLLFQYGPSKGVINELISQALEKDENIVVAPEALVTTVGCQEAIVLCLRALCSKDGDVLAVINPSFVGIMGAARVFDIDMMPINEYRESIDWDGLAQACEHAAAQGQKIQALYVAPDFSNPSGTILSLADRKKLLRFAQTYDFIILEDNAYGFTAETATKLPTLKSLDQHRRVIYLGTCAKTCMPGVRIGFVVADQQIEQQHNQAYFLADALATLKSMITVNTPPVCQAIVGGMLLENNLSLNQISDDKALLYRENLNWLLTCLENELGEQRSTLGLSWNCPTGGFFVRLTLPIKVDTELLTVSAEKYHVIWTPMNFFSLNELGDYELRLSCSFLTHSEIEQGIRRLSNFLKDVCSAPDALLTAVPEIAVLETSN